MSIFFLILSLLSLTYAQGANHTASSGEVSVSVHDTSKEGRNTLRIWALNQPSSKQRCGGNGTQWATITNHHGVPVSLITAPPGKPIGFVLAYWDGNGDNVIDGQVYAMPVDDNDLALPAQDDVWVSRPAGREDIRLVYLHVVRIEHVLGFGRVPVLRPVRKDDPHGAIACYMDQLEPWAGHLATSAATMAQQRH